MDSIKRKRRPNPAWAAARQAEAVQLGGWYWSGLWDGLSSDGRELHGELYSHPDGREVAVFGHMYCSDPELQALLTARAKALAEDEEVQPRPLFWRAMDMVLKGVRACVGRRHA
jgi:hypothetical protein